jgi:uncharacterized membrane protein
VIGTLQFLLCVHYFLLLSLLTILYLSIVPLLSSLLLYLFKVHVEDWVYQVAAINVDLDCDVLLNFE